MKIPIVALLAITILFGLLALPALASEQKAPTQVSFSSQLDHQLSALLQVTFTTASTVYLPVIIRQPSYVRIPEIGFLDNEYIMIKNEGPGEQSLDGWQMISVVGSQTYTFPDGITLYAGEFVRVRSGPLAFSNPPLDLFWTTAFIWNDDGDKAVLWDNKGAFRDTTCYGSGCVPGQ